MVYLVIELVLIALFAGFILLTQYEKHRGVRFASKFRNGIDIFATKIAFIKNHVDFADFVKDTFPSRIVFEAMMNAVRHPEATKIVTTSHIQWHLKRR